MRIRYILCMCFVAVMMCSGSAEAADFNASVSSESCTQGDTVNVTVTFSSNENIGAYYMKMTYDPNLLEYVSGAYGGGGGTLQFYNDYVNSTTNSYTVSFTAKAAGTSTLALDVLDTPINMNGDNMTFKASNGAVTISAPAVASSDNRLSALNVALVYEDGRTEAAALTPAFSPDVTSYQLSISKDVARLSLDASASDGKAAVAVSGTRMDPGSNTTTVTVTAENGEVRKYIIYTEKEQIAKSQSIQNPKESNLKRQKKGYIADCIEDTVLFFHIDTAQRLTEKIIADMPFSLFRCLP